MYPNYMYAQRYMYLTTLDSLVQQSKWKFHSTAKSMA